MERVVYDCSHTLIDADGTNLGVIQFREPLTEEEIAEREADARAEAVRLAAENTLSEQLAAARPSPEVQAKLLSGEKLKPAETAEVNRFVALQMLHGGALGAS